VHEPVVPPAEQDKVVEHRLAAARPVADVVRVDNAVVFAAWEPAASVARP